MISRRPFARLRGSPGRSGCCLNCMTFLLAPVRGILTIRAAVVAEQVARIPEDETFRRGFGAAAAVDLAAEDLPLRAPRAFGLRWGDAVCGRTRRFAGGLRARGGTLLLHFTTPKVRAAYECRTCATYGAVPFRTAIPHRSRQVVVRTRVRHFPRGPSECASIAAPHRGDRETRDGDESGRREYRRHRIHDAGRNTHDPIRIHDRRLAQIAPASGKRDRLPVLDELRESVAQFRS